MELGARRHPAQGGRRRLLLRRRADRRDLHREEPHGDGRDELYVASDDQNEVRRYTWKDGAWTKEVLYRYEPKMPGFTWNLTAVRAALVPRSVWE